MVLTNANTSNSGEYRCEAWNEYSKASSTVPLLVEGTIVMKHPPMRSDNLLAGRIVHPRCKDNPFFANCQLIVRGKHCNHKFYAKFCCKSCTEAGLLPTFGPHLDEDNSSRPQSNTI